MFTAGWVSNTGWGFRFTKNPRGGWLFGHEGYGGQYVKGDPDTGLAFAYLTNSLKTSSSDEGVRAFQNLQTALYQSFYSANTTDASRRNTTGTLTFTTSQPFVEK
uniref:Beta-lactamase-related domain-containing protein n=1 Tax=Plectus sambesii TaxID=2011161 RepID=A0A914X3F1_9BILA